ncbi:MAG: ROK family protein [Chloroflexi bacterium]|nr:ROK family protein [Chloroflexota bacterium]
MTDGQILGIDIGGTKLAVGLATPEGGLLARERRPSGMVDGPDAVIGRVVEMARAVISEAGTGAGEVTRIGIGCGGPLDPWRGVVLNALNNAGWIDIPLTDRLSDALGAPAYLDNDANAAALGEHRFGAGRGTANMVYLTVSTGVGGGVIAGGRLLRGENGNAAELGHLTVDAHGRPCQCGSVGCLEAYASGTNIAARAREALAACDEPSRLRSGPVADLTAADVSAAAEAGDPLAARVWSETTTLLGAGISSMIHAFNPSLVVLGGGVTAAGDLLLGPVRRAAAERTMPWLHEVVRIVPAELGDRAGILGAVAVALDGPRTLAERPTSHVHGRTDA